MRTSKVAAVAVSVLAGGLLAACGGSGNEAKKSGSNTGAPTATSGPSGAAGGGASALSAESQSLATGDIPDSQVFLTFRDARGGYSLRYPEGWSQRSAQDGVTFVNRNNVIRLTLSRGAPPTPAAVLAELARERSKQPTLAYGPYSTASIGGAAAVKVSYSTLSPPSSVTGKSVRLLVDRYVFAHGGRVATLDLGTPTGVDNVDAYRKIASSFHWLQ
jgi:hypothetical protein